MAWAKNTRGNNLVMSGSAWSRNVWSEDYKVVTELLKMAKKKENRGGNDRGSDAAWETARGGDKATRYYTASGTVCRLG